VTAANAAAASNNAVRSNGGLYGSEALKDHPDERGVYDLHEAKVDAVEEIIEELQGVRPSSLMSTNIFGSSTKTLPARALGRWRRVCVALC